ncbi:MAG: hypothetical protein Q4P29_05650 [Tissierellia bacterium]|nr:hypothetical protein [Tissierellia bacterium]
MKRKNILILLILLMGALLLACSQTKKESKIRFETNLDKHLEKELEKILIHIKSEELSDKDLEPIDLYYELKNDLAEEDLLKLPKGSYKIDYPNLLDKDLNIYKIDGPKEAILDSQTDKIDINLRIEKLEDLTLEERESSISEIEKFDEDAKNLLLSDDIKEKIKTMKEELAKEQEKARLMNNAFENYKKVLEDPKSYIELDNPDVDFSYYIYNISNTDIPQLFLSHFSTQYYNAIISMAYIDTNTDELKIIDRFAIESARVGIGLYEGSFVSSYISGTGNYEEYHIKLIDNKTEEKLMRAFHMDDENIPEPFEKEEFAWTDIYNMTSLYEEFNRPKTEIENAKKEYEKKLESIKTKIIEDAKAKGNLILKGTLHVLQNNEEMLEFQGKEDPNKLYGHSYDYGPYYILELDEAGEFTNYSPDGEVYIGSTQLINLWEIEKAELNGKRVIAITNSDGLIWPSDSSIPIGVPGTSCIEIYEDN